MSTSNVQKLSEDETIRSLITWVDVAFKNGAFGLGFAKILKKAKDFFDPAVKTKPSFSEDDANPERTALNVIVQAVNGACRNGAYTLEEAAAIVDLIEHLNELERSKEGEDGIGRRRTQGGMVRNGKTKQEDSDDEEFQEQQYRSKTR